MHRYKVIEKDLHLLLPTIHDLPKNIALPKKLQKGKVIQAHNRDFYLANKNKPNFLTTFFFLLLPKGSLSIFSEIKNRD